MKKKTCHHERILKSYTTDRCQCLTCYRSWDSLEAFQKEQQRKKDRPHQICTVWNLEQFYSVKQYIDQLIQLSFLEQIPCDTYLGHHREQILECSMQKDSVLILPKTYVKKKNDNI